jgi:predicted nucleic acid-binding protein
VTTPPTVLLDGSFLDALTDADAKWCAVARDLYLSLVDAYERHEIRLRARVDDLRRHDAHRRELLAPVESIHVAAQHRRAARRVAATEGLHDDAALTLVIMQRERIRRIATFDPVFSSLADVEVVRRSTAP